MQAQQQTHTNRIYENPVFRGDYPDPSVVRIGDDFWATTTSTEWAPQFPLLHSRDLVHWTQTGAVFNEPPAWASGKFWAPEISVHDGVCFVYYVAQHTGGPLTIGVATASDPRGPYTDHGPLVGQASGSIDPTAVTAQNGERFLIWKEDGNSIGLPTTIWMQQLSADGLRLTGEAAPILRNDAAWEGRVIEAPSVLYRDGFYYMFYSGNACCGRNCKYAVGVARAASLLGPWEKFSGNPILKGNANWRCPGHGSIVAGKDGRTFYLYHAYSRRDSIFVGRQTLLDEVHWDANWPYFEGHSPSSAAARPFIKRARGLRLRLAAATPAGEWQWPNNKRPQVEFGKWFDRERIVLGPPHPGVAHDTLGSVIARSPHYGDYDAETVLDVRALAPGVEAGLCAYGDSNNALGISYQDGTVRIWQRSAGKHRILRELTYENRRTLRMRMRAHRGYQFAFDIRQNGRWLTVRTAPLRAAHLPPWDRGIRIGLTAGGTPDAHAVFRYLRIRKDSSCARLRVLPSVAPEQVKQHVIRTVKAAS